jgi:hypothetical protein
VLDGHVRPGARDDDRVGAEAREQVLESSALPGAHAHLLDDEVAVLRLQAVGRRGAPRVTHERIRVLDALEERRVQLQAGRTRLDDVVHVDHRDPRRAGRCSEVLDVLDDVLLLRVLGRAAVGEGPAFDDHVVLEILDDQDALARIDGEVGHPAS